MKKILEYLSFIFLFICLTGCKREDQRQDNNSNNKSNLSSEIWKVAGVAGQVIDEQNEPLSGAMVQFGNKSVSTDVNGYFKFDQASFNTPSAFVTVKKTGYFNGSRAFIPRMGSNNYLKIQMLPVKIIGSVDATTGGTVTLSNGISIVFPGNGIINSANETIGGKVLVSVAYINPTLPDYDLQMPGNLIGISKDNQQKLIRSFGMMAVQLISSTGEIVNIKSGYSAILTFPYLPGLGSASPASIPLWSFDESTGIWKEEGQANRQRGGIYAGTVNHFSFWNVGDPEDYVKLSMRLVGAGTKPVEGIKVMLTSLYTDASTYDFTDNLGYIDGYVPKEDPLTMHVIDNCQNEILNQNILPLTSDKDLGDISLPGSLNLQTITGKVQDCSGHALISGTLQVLLDGSHFEFTNIQNGSFSLTFLNCSGSNTVNLVAIDESSMQKSNSIPLVLSSDDNDAGVIQACGVEIPPYFNIYIDGVAQSWPNNVFGGWISTDESFGDNSSVVELFKGDTTQGRIGLDFNIKLYNPIHQPDSATLISVSIDRGSPLWYQAIDQSNFMVKFNLFGDVGKIIEGNFNGIFEKLYGCCPNSTVLDTVNISGDFRFRRDVQWWNH